LPLVLLVLPLLLPPPELMVRYDSSKAGLCVPGPSEL
jgi:hypothetical protein